MFIFLVRESFLDKPIVAGYSIRSIFKFWWIGLIVILVLVGALVATYILLNHVLGKKKFQEGDVETVDEYKASPKSERKAIRANASKPVQNVLLWRAMRGWLIPVVCVVALLGGAAASFLPSPAFENLMTTLRGSAVRVYDSETSRQAAAEAEENVITIEEEGLVLLKNTNDSLPIATSKENKTKINIFGSCAYGLFYGNGGSGSFQTDGRYKSFPRVATKLEVALQEEGFEINDNLYNMIKNYYSSNGRTVSIAHSDYDIQCGFNKYNYSEIVDSKAPYDYEPQVSDYEKTFSELGGKSILEDAKDFSDIAIFCVTRRGSEDEDMNYSELKLKEREAAAIEMLKENFDNVIILLNVPTVIEAGFLDAPEIDSAIYIGHPGLTGTTAIARAISGTVNPSGHLVDTWPYSVKSAPSYQNFGNDTTLTHTGYSSGKFTQYVEGIYVGYRYYVTRAMEESDFIYEDEVQFSFGHGLSYTTFDKSIVEFAVNESAQTIDLTVEVKNTGDVPGKDVIQIYTHAPYYAGGIEKSYYSLSTFGKTNDIQPGETKDYHFQMKFRDLASWSTENGYYVLERGDYEISLRENVWNIAKTATSNSNARTFNLASDVEFKTSYETGKEYENIFQDVEWGADNTKAQYLSRNDFTGTWQNTNQINTNSVEGKFPGGASNQTSGRSFSFSDNQIDEPTPVTGAKNYLELADLKDADWDDDAWEDLLDELTVNDLQTIVDTGSFKTAAIKSINKREATDYDGPGAAFHSGTGHPSEVIVGCTWSTDVARIMGESIGKEGAARGLTGWYAPGINTHRSPFGGRNFEYYSEDPLIAGKMAGATAKGSMKYGVYTYAKHFICNEQENTRAGVFVWATEQSIREIYARGFELYVNDGGLGIMSSFNCIGSWWTGGSKALLTTLLREEWGFHGVVVTDYAGPDYMATNIGLRAGNDLWLNKASYPAADTYNQTRHDGLILMRRAAKNILYACSHSNCVWTEEDYHAAGIEEAPKFD